MSSKARGDLRGRLAEVYTLTALDPARGGMSNNAHLGNAVNRSCLIMLSAHLEGYLEDLMVEAIDALVTAGVVVERVPLLLRALHTESYLKQIEPIRDRNARAPRIQQMFETESSMWAPGSRVKASMLKAKLVCAEMSNPGSKEISSFLNLLGVNLDNHLNTTGERQLLNQVNGLIYKRNAIAHGDASTMATFGDVDIYLALVEKLADQIDTAVALGVQVTAGQTHLPW